MQQHKRGHKKICQVKANGTLIRLMMMIVVINYTVVTDWDAAGDYNDGE
jgi:hypothetical protein